MLMQRCGKRGVVAPLLVALGGGLWALSAVAGPTNTPPAAADDVVAVVAGEEMLIDVLANDHDADGDQLTVSLIGSMAGLVGNDDGTFTYTPPAGGLADVVSFQYTLTDGHGGQDTATVKIAPPEKLGTVNLRPTASFLRLGCDDTRTCSFDARSSTDDDLITRYDWKFDSGAAAVALSATPSHTYTVSGVHQVTLTVWDAANQTDSVTLPVRIDLPPTASFTVGCGNTRSCSFNPAASSDDQADGTPPSYAWELGDGRTSTQPLPPSQQYGASGIYPTRLTLTDSYGQTGSATLDLVLPETTVRCGDPIPNKCDFIAAPVRDNLRPELDYSWQFGDGTVASDVDTPSHLYSASSIGTYRLVRLTASDPSGSQAQETVFRDLSLALPDFLADCQNRVCTFTGLPASNPPGSLFYSWTFTDGNDSGETVGRSYSAGSPAIFDVTLKVSDSPVRQSSTTTARLALPSFTSSCEDLECSFAATPTPTEVGSGFTYAWTFHLRSDPTGAGDTTATGDQVDYTFPDDGIYDVALTLGDGRRQATETQALDVFDEINFLLLVLFD